MIFRQFASGAVNRATTTLDGYAGKSINVAKVLQVLGADCVATGFLGGNRGQELRASLEDRGVKCEFVTITAPTRLCITVIDEYADAVTELVEESRPAEAADYEKLLVIVQRQLATCRAVIMSGTIASNGPSDLYFQCVRLAQAAHVLTIVDATGPALIEALKASPGLVKPNRAELAATVGCPLSDEKSVTSAMCELHRRGAERVVVTAGGDPTLAFDGCEFWRATTPKVKALNPIGSGDAFTAGLAWRLNAGDGLGEACRWATAAGVANTLTPMPGELRREDVEHLAPLVMVERVTNAARC
jgi:tagatose 6-phosphate kinase